MKRITKFTKTNLNNVRTEINKKLKELESLGLDIKLKGITFDDTYFNAKIECSIVGSADEYEREFQYNTFASQIPKDFVGKTFVSSGEIWIFRGYKPRARKDIVIAENKKGQLYRMDVKRVEKVILSQ